LARWLEDEVFPAADSVQQESLTLIPRDDGHIEVEPATGSGVSTLCDCRELCSFLRDCGMDEMQLDTRLGSNQVEDVLRPLMAYRRCLASTDQDMDPGRIPALLRSQDGLHFNWMHFHVQDGAVIAQYSYCVTHLSLAVRWFERQHGHFADHRTLYRYPHAAFPCTELVEENQRCGKGGGECELADTGVFEDGRYFDVYVEYAKAGPDKILMRISIRNQADVEAAIHVLPQVWFRNTWSWETDAEKPELCVEAGQVVCEPPELGRRFLQADEDPEWLCCENETNRLKLWGEGEPGHDKDAFHEYVVDGREEAVNPEIRRHRPGRGLAGQRRVGLYDRRDAVRRRRHYAVSRLRFRGIEARAGVRAP
jgi:hypothetical protein